MLVVRCRGQIKCSYWILDKSHKQLMQTKPSYFSVSKETDFYFIYFLNSWIHILPITKNVEEEEEIVCCATLTYMTSEQLKENLTAAKMGEEKFFHIWSRVGAKNVEATVVNVILCSQRIHTNFIL